jgi:endoribonuclease Dicer
MKEKNRNKKIVFLVDRIPLVFQQADAIEKETKLQALRCCGDTFEQSQLQQPYDVLVVIASLYINLLSKNLASLEEVSLIVIDEAHHITKDHPFAVILRDYYMNIPRERSHLRPRVLGLTASPAGEESFFGTYLRLKVLTKTADSMVRTILVLD